MSAKYRSPFSACLLPVLLLLSTVTRGVASQQGNPPPQETTPESAAPQEPFVGPPKPPPPPSGLLPLRVVSELTTPTYPITPVLFQQDGLIIACRRGIVQGYEAATGNFAWKLGLPDEELLAPQPIPEGVLVALRDGTLLVVDTSTGAILEESSSPIPLTLPPWVGDGMEILASPLGQVVALDTASREVLWRADLEEAPSAVVKGGDLVVISGAEGTLTALDAQSGRSQWSLRGRGPFRAPAVFDADRERIYIGDDAGVLYSLSAENGKSHYRWELGAAIVHPVLIEQDRLYVVTYGNSLLAYRRANGHELWRIDLPGRPASPPVRAVQRLVVATLDGFVVEVDPDRGRAVGSPYQAPTGIRSDASFDPPYAALTLLSGKVLLLETAPPSPAPEKAKPTEKPTEVKERKRSEPFGGHRCPQ